MHPHTQFPGNWHMFWDQLATISFLVKITFMMCWPLTNLSVCTNKCSQTRLSTRKTHDPVFAIVTSFLLIFLSCHGLSLQWVSIFEVLHVCQSPQTISKPIVCLQAVETISHTDFTEIVMSYVLSVLSLGPVVCCWPKSAAHRHLQYVCKQLSHVPTHPMSRKVAYVLRPVDNTFPLSKITLLWCVDSLTILSLCTKKCSQTILSTRKCARRILSL